MEALSFPIVDASGVTVFAPVGSVATSSWQSVNRMGTDTGSTVNENNLSAFPTTQLAQLYSSLHHYVVMQHYQQDNGDARSWEVLSHVRSKSVLRRALE